MVCHGQHTYLYSQCLLNMVAQDPYYGAKFKRASQEVQMKAVQRLAIYYENKEDIE